MTTTEIAQHHRNEAATCRKRGLALQNAELTDDWTAQALWHEAAAEHLEGLEVRKDEHWCASI